MVITIHGEAIAAITKVISILSETCKSTMQCWCDSALAVLQLPPREHTHSFDFAVTNHAAWPIDSTREHTVNTIVTAITIVAGTNKKSSGTYSIHTALLSAVCSARREEVK